MKKRIGFFAVVFALAIISTGIFVYASPDNHTHNYQVAAFDGSNATLTCRICGESEEEAFSGHLNERGYAPLDMNDDGIVNAKDYAYLIKHYNEYGPISSWGGPEADF